MSEHKMFPWGLNCSHCDIWHSLADSIEHSQEFHQDCTMCSAEAMLSQAMLDEAAEALVIVTDRRRKVS